MFCERQCALIHVERLWVENRLTIEGRHLHERAHDGLDEVRDGVSIARGMPLRSVGLGLYGVADVVELHRETRDWPRGLNHSRDAVAFASLASANRVPVAVPCGNVSLQTQGLTRIVPIEYKRGRPKKDDSDRVQLCAQAICLEEIFGKSVEVGYLYYGKRRRRTEVVIDPTLRERTITAARRLHEMICQRETPRATREPKCDGCSLLELCLPGGTSPELDAGRQFSKRLASSIASSGPSDDCEFDSF